MSLSNIEIAGLLLALWVFLVNVTYISSTFGWIIGLAAFVIILIPHLTRR